MNNIIIDEDIKKSIEEFSILSSKLERLFETFNYKGENIYIRLVDSLKTMSEILGEQVPDWVIGCYKNNDVYILESSNWKNKDVSTVIELILHETIHIIVNNVTKYSCPLWLNEAIAVYFSGQGRSIAEDNDIELKNPYFLSYDDNIYYNSYVVLKNIIEKYSIDKLVERLSQSEDLSEDYILGEVAVKLLCDKYNCKDDM